MQVDAFDLLGEPKEVIVLKEEIPEEPNGEFFGPGSEEEFKRHEREEKGFKNIFGLDS